MPNAMFSSYDSFYDLPYEFTLRLMLYDSLYDFFVFLSLITSISLHRTLPLTLNENIGNHPF